jgi:hypothetical protein
MKNTILDFFKVFSDIQRIRLAALLAEGPKTVEQMAAHLNIRLAEIPRQLNQMQKLNLLVQEGSTYRLDVKGLEKLSREVLANQRPQAAEESNDESADDYDRKVVKNYSLPGGRLREIPMQEKKLLSILRHVVQVFEPGTRYTEKQVNAALSNFHEDTAFLRRSLVDFKLIERENNGSAYWRN